MITVTDVIVVVEPNFGDQLLRLPKVNVWICKSDVNSPAVAQLRSSDADERFTSLTEYLLAVRNEEELLLLLESIEDHHGAHSPPIWRQLEVFGALPTPGVTKHFKDLGAVSLTPTARGFSIRR